MMENINKFWEEEYSKGAMLNKYPFNYLVQIVMKYFGNIENKSNVKVLEVGCGAGNNLHFLASEGFEVDGFDLSKSAISFAKKRFSQSNLKGNFEVSGFDFLENKENQYDLIIERGVFYTQSLSYLRSEVFPMIKKALKNNGLFISYYFNDNHPDKDFLKGMDVLSTPNKEEILILFSIFNVESIAENSMRDVFGKSILREKSEYIIIAKKIDE